MASDIPDGDICTRVGNVCVNCDELWPCRVRLQATTARLQALLAERDAEIARLREAIDAVVFSLFYVGVGEARRYYVADGYGPAFSAAVRAALAARGNQR